MNFRTAIAGGTTYLAQLVQHGICRGDFGFRHGASDAWTTAIVGSTLTTLAYPKIPEMVAALLQLQHHTGGWGYNRKTAPDADTTLRVIQFFQKSGIVGPSIIKRAQRFVLLHQQKDGGFATYLPQAVQSMQYPIGGWTASHACVSALALNLLPRGNEKNALIRYLTDRKKDRDFRSYWWKGGRYFAHLTYEVVTNEPVTDDALDIALELLCKSNYRGYDTALCKRLEAKQLADGSFEATRLFHIPRPEQFLEDCTGNEEVADDKQRILSTCAAIVALRRQVALRA